MAEKQSNETDRVSILENELRMMREEHAAELAAIRADLQAARQVSADGSNVDATKELISHFDSALLAEQMRKKTDEFAEKQARFACDTFKAAIAGEQLFYVLAEAGPDYNGTGAIISLPGTAAVIGIDSPEQDLALQR